MNSRSYVDEAVDEILADTEGRFVVIGTPEEAQSGDALIFDAVKHGWIRFSSTGPDDGADLNAKVVRQMVQRGAKVLPQAPTND